MVEDKFEVITNDRGAVYYYKNNKFHREEGPAIEYANGDQEWYKEGKLHRENGPAYISMNGSYKEWWNNNKLHRLDGPAIITSSFNEWYYGGEKIKCSSQQEFEKFLKLKVFM